MSGQIPDSTVHDEELDELVEIIKYVGNEYQIYVSVEDFYNTLFFSELVYFTYEEEQPTDVKWVGTTGYWFSPDYRRAEKVIEDNIEILPGSAWNNTPQKFKFDKYHPVVNTDLIEQRHRKHISTAIECLLNTGFDEFYKKFTRGFEAWERVGYSVPLRWSQSLHNKVEENVKSWVEIHTN